MEEPARAFEVGESFARILTETTQSLVCVLDRDGRILLFNEACERATGYRRDEVHRPRRARPRDPARGARGVRRVPDLRLADRGAEPAGRPLADQAGPAAADRVVQPPDARPRTATPAALVTTGIDLTDRESPSRDVEGALAADPGEKLAEIGRLATEQRALRRVATLVASEVSPERVFTAVSEGCARVLEVNASTVVRYEGDGTATVLGRHNRDSIDVFRVGERIRADEDSALARVRRTAAPRADRRLGRPRGRRSPRRCSARATARPPRRRSWSPARCGARWRSPARTRCRPTARTGSARSASSPRWPSRAPRRARTSPPRAPASCAAGDEQRRRLERNLHDGAQQRLVSVALMLRLARAGSAEARGGRGQAARRRLARARHRAGGAARARPRPAPRGARRPRPAARARGADRAAAGARRHRRGARGAPARRTSRRPRTTSSPRR